MQKRKPLHETRALALAALSSKLGSVFTVVASPELKVTKTEVATVSCKHCSTKFGALASTQPFCVTCGSDEVEQVENESPAESLTDNDDLSAVTCNHCSTHNILSSTTAATLNGKMFCTACGEPVGFSAPAEETDIIDLSEVEADNDLDGNDLGGDALQEEKQEATEDEDTDEDEADDADDSEDDDEKSESEQKPATATQEDVVDVDLVDTVDSDKEAQLSFSLLDGTLVASVNGIPVSTLTKETAGVNSDVYTKQSFADAVEHSVARMGVSAALQHYGFQHIVVAFPLKKLVEARVAQEMATIKSQETATLDDIKADLQQCLAIASLGLNKNFFKGKDNALKAGFYEELSNAGVVNPAKVVERVFAHYSESYITTLLATAEELMAKSIDVRNQLAEAVDGINSVDVADDDEAEDTDLNNVEVTARLAGSTLRPERKVAETASVSVSTIRKALPGGRLF